LVEVIDPVRERCHTGATDWRAIATVNDVCDADERLT
jgi:hypothetical protein